jgi:hypothetical protein
MSLFAKMKAIVVEKFRAAREWFKAKLTKETPATPEPVNQRGVHIVCRNPNIIRMEKTDRFHRVHLATFADKRSTSRSIMKGETS